MAISSSRTKFEYVCDVLRQRIESGEYAPGQRLNIHDVAQSMNTSDIPVREAIHRLAAEGYVLYMPRVGVIVAQASLDEVRQLLVTLAILEGTITRLAAPHVSAAVLEQLNEIVAAQKEAVCDAQKFGELNRQFHAALWSACQVGALVETASAVKDRIDRQKPFSLFGYVPTRMKRAVAEHEQLLRLLDQRPLPLDRIEAFARWHKLQFVQALGSGELASEVQRAILLPPEP